ncbi:hypothetical protein [Halovivax gelatinilyticus]|uniref:hypothetical protein n=1 Tax=Halovivax gelatinilyticus TaxID=2961597 RepID=UPI0020CA4123|nr:hypothetical protein [Halovivax gelatinilyticus]
MSRAKRIGQFVAVALPSLFMLLWTLDAALVLGEDVFVIALLQVVFIAVFMWRWHAPPQPSDSDSL